MPGLVASGTHCIYQYKLRGSYYNNRGYAIVDEDYHMVSPE